MRTIFTVLLFLFSQLNICAQEKQGLVFEKRIIDIGNIEIKQANEVIKFNFPFQNKGEKTLVIHNVSAVCGCTVPSWPKTPIRPNKKGNIEVTLKTKGIKGFFLKQLFVESNSDQDGIILLKIKGEIK